MAYTWIPTRNPLLQLVLERTWPLLLVAACLLALRWRRALVVQRAEADVWSKIPEVGAALGGQQKRRMYYLAKGKELYAEGFRKFKNGVFRLETPPGTSIVISTKYLDELRALPDDTVSRGAATVKLFYTRYVRLSKGGTELLSTAIKRQLTAALPRITETLSSAIGEGIIDSLPSSPSWTPVKTMDALRRSVAIATGRIFIGPELYNDERYIDSVFHYSIDTMEVKSAIDLVSPWLRWWKAPRLPEVRRIADRVKRFGEFIEPVVKARWQNRKEGREQPDDMLTWLMDLWCDADEANKSADADTVVERMTLAQLGASFAAIHTTTIMLTDIIYTLAVMPDVADELRDELRGVLAAHDNRFSAAAFQAMMKTDSYMRETARLFPQGEVTFVRGVRKSFTLSSGQTIPEGSIIEVPMALHNVDPAVYPDPLKFDPWRTYKPREEARRAGDAETAAKLQAVTVTHENLGFGWGRHACPGRFFAVNEVKMMLCILLLEYEFRMPGCDRGVKVDMSDRYANLEVGRFKTPDPSKILEFRRTGGAQALGIIPRESVA